MKTAGWGSVLILALITAALSVLNPMLLMLVPFAFLSVAFQPHKRFQLVIALVLLISAFTGKPDSVLWWYARGWALILSAWFVLMVVALPSRGLTARALAALAGSIATVTVLFAFSHGGWYALDTAVTGQLRAGAADVATFWSQRVQNQTWTQSLATSIYKFADFQSFTYPALLGIASLSGLAVAWWLWRRLSVQELQPLGLLRNFRFTDELVWVVVLGAALIVLPLHGIATRTGTNLLTFMAALYALRGLAVLVALFGMPGLLGTLFGALIVVMLYPIVMATTLMVGLTDTWLDLRARALTRQDHEKH